MFTGIVVGGEVVKVERAGEDSRLWISSKILGDCEAGASVAIDGVCLTVTDRDGDVCRFDVSAESLARSTLGRKEAGQHVNVERPLRAGQELGGHIVQGHVDGIGRIVDVAPEGAGRRITVSLPRDLERYVVSKGSIALDGVSLTVTNVSDGRFEVALVPHTLAVTSFGRVKPGHEVNVEIDVLAKYVERMVSPE
jgi:riboflavin synthase